jgi:hypothetical protein
MYTDVHRDAPGTRCEIATRDRSARCTKIRTAIHRNDSIAARRAANVKDSTECRVISSALYRVRSRRLARRGKHDRPQSQTVDPLMKVAAKGAPHEATGQGHEGERTRIQKIVGNYRGSERRRRVANANETRPSPASTPAVQRSRTPHGTFALINLAFGTSRRVPETRPGVGERRRMAGGRGSCLDPFARRSRCRVTGGAFGR